MLWRKTFSLQSPAFPPSTFSERCPRMSQLAGCSRRHSNSMKGVLQVSNNILSKAATTARTKTLLSVFGVKAIITADKDEGPA